MNRLINLIIVKRINHNINKFAIAKFVHDHKQQFVSDNIDFNCLHKLHSMMWTNIIKYYDNYKFGPIRIDKVKSKILKRLVEDIKQQTFSMHSCDKFEFISNLESLFRTLQNYNYNCFACYYACNDCNCCPIIQWRNVTCREYGELYRLTKNEKDFKSNKQDMLNLCKEIRDLEWGD